ncbi:unnamed protein product [Xylocopa violacea]|uniref:Uncharacterized protein n=1 Tax=Xylocopa violacea TaxID=135666 RepID=A0ABP1MYQ4_XYLVO
MKKRSNHENKAGKSRQNDNETKAAEEKKEKEDGNGIILQDDTDNQGFSDWLRSSDGLEMMRLFVIANSILIFVTMGVPKMQEVIGLLNDYFFGTNN